MTLPVSNSSPIIHLSRLTKTGYVRKVFSSLMIPPSVRTEAIHRGIAEGYSEARILERLEKEGWLQLVRPSNESMNLAREFAGTVGRGEAEAIALALEKKERLLIDDEKARRIAQLYDIETTTTLGLLFEFLVQGVLTKVDYRKNVKNYAAQGWITPDVLQEFLERGDQFE